jgi:[pyruvate, water dikinase]-phosphate phosphotransferase / [pyruvate, water dikinase] kinase
MIDMQEDVPFHIYIVSGGKGIAGDAVVQALLAQFPNAEVPVIMAPETQSEEDLIEAVNKAKETGGVIVHTMVDKNLRGILNQLCHDYGVRSFDLMGELSDFLVEKIGIQPLAQPGLYRKLHQDYFERIEAVEYTLSTDDGMNPAKLSKADIVLTGVSRTGKTPLSIYLAMYGWKVSNIPLVNNIPPPSQLFEVDPNRVFGLTINPSNLIVQRYKRLERLGKMETEETNYVNPRDVGQELEYAERIFAKGGFKVINVTNKPVESSANEIIGFLNQSYGTHSRRLARE